MKLRRRLIAMSVAMVILGGVGAIPAQATPGNPQVFNTGQCVKLGFDRAANPATGLGPLVENKNGQHGPFFGSGNNNPLTGGQACG